MLAQITDRDYPHIADTIGGFLRDGIKGAGADGLVMGLSGGVDSAAVAALCSRAGANTLALVMPDSKVSPRGETDDAVKLAKTLGIKHKLIDICRIVEEYSGHLEPDRLAEGNLRARIRSNILYYYANTGNRLVLGSGDKSEWLIGYFTKFGDGAADLAPLLSLYKLQVRRMAEYLGVPQEIVSKKSSPHLWKGQTAEGEIGAKYEEIDAILYHTLEKGMDTGELAEKCGIKIETIKKILALNKGSEHKRCAMRGIR